MSHYVEKNLFKGETIIKQAKLSKAEVVTAWIWGVLFFWLLFPLIIAIVVTVRHGRTELVISNKRITGKTGVANVSTFDAPLSKIQNVSTSKGLGGKMFNYGTIVVTTAAGNCVFAGIKNVDEFKNAIMEEIDRAEDDKIELQAKKIAEALVAPKEAQPVEVQPVEAQPVEVQPVEAQPAEAQLAEAQPAEAQPAEA